MSEQFWTDLSLHPDDAEFSTLGFLVERLDTIHNTSTYDIRDRPPVTNQSRKPRPLGWCGTYDDASIYGRGIWRVVKTLPNGRCLLQRVTKRGEICEFLESVGFPSLIDELCICAGGGK